MPNVRGDKRRTIVCPDDLWDGLGEYAAERSTTRGAVIREQIHELLEDADIIEFGEVTESGEEPAEPA
jgi:hypothetical protein